MIRVLLLLVISSSYLTAQSNYWKDKFSPEILRQVDEQSLMDVLIIFKAKPDITDAYKLKGKFAKGQLVFQLLNETSQKAQKRTRNILEANAYFYTSFFIVNAISAKVDYTTLQLIAQLDEVKSIAPNPSVMMEELADNPIASLNFRNAIEWGIEMIGADQVWEMGYQGQGVVVGGQDTGYEWEHSALQRQYRGWDGVEADHNYNWHDAIHEINPMHGDSTLEASHNPCGLDSTVPCDDNNHGTHTMGTMIGDDGDGNQIGIAPQAQWIACRNMERGYGTPASYLESFQWFLAPTDLNNENPDPTKAPHVINNSWSCPVKEGCDASNWSLLEEAVINLKAAGVVVVVSAGNSGSGCATVNTPSAIFKSSFSVGATNFGDNITSFSSRGPVMVDESGRLKPDISAPGATIRSAIRGDRYAHFSGTSMAGPHVAGVVALMISAQPELAGEVELIEEIIRTTAVAKTTTENCGDIPGSEIPNNTYGYGRIDALAAVQAALTTTDVDEPIKGVQLQVFPNPAINQLNLVLTEKVNTLTIRIINNLGQVLLTENIEAQAHTTFRLDVSKLPAGQYLYTCTDGQQQWSGKFIK